MWQLLYQIWTFIEPDEAGQGQTEYMLLLSLAVISVLLALAAFGTAVYYFWEELVNTLPF